MDALLLGILIIAGCVWLFMPDEKSTQSQFLVLSRRVTMYFGPWLIAGLMVWCLKTVWDDRELLNTLVGGNDWIFKQMFACVLITLAISLIMRLTGVAGSAQTLFAAVCGTMALLSVGPFLEYMNDSPDKVFPSSLIRYVYPVVSVGMVIAVVAQVRLVWTGFREFRHGPNKSAQSKDVSRKQ